VRIDVRRWGVFNLVGFGGFVVQLAAITVLTRALGWSPVVATLVALELAALQNFIGHSRWTWRDAPVAGIRSWLTRYWRYQVAKTASLGANLAITTGLIYFDLPPEAANTAAVLLCALPNYFISERYVFGYTSRPC
jgi:putative flippase GtrA